MKMDVVLETIVYALICMYLQVHALIFYVLASSSAHTHIFITLKFKVGSIIFHTYVE